MHYFLTKLAQLADRFEKTLAQANLIPENKTLIKNKLIDLINRKYNSIKSPDKILVSLFVLSDRNSLSLGFVYGGKTLTRVDSEIAMSIENELNQLVSGDDNLKIIFNKSFPVSNFGLLEVKGNELTLRAPTVSETRKVRTEI